MEGVELFCNKSNLKPLLQAQCNSGEVFMDSGFMDAMEMKGRNSMNNVTKPDSNFDGRCGSFGLGNGSINEYDLYSSTRNRDRFAKTIPTISIDCQSSETPCGYDPQNVSMISENSERSPQGDTHHKMLAQTLEERLMKMLNLHSGCVVVGKEHKRLEQSDWSTRCVGVLRGSSSCRFGCCCHGESRTQVKCENSEYDESPVIPRCFSTLANRCCSSSEYCTKNDIMRGGRSGETGNYDETLILPTRPATAGSVTSLSRFNYRPRGVCVFDNSNESLLSRREPCQLISNEEYQFDNNIRCPTDKQQALLVVDDDGIGFGRNSKSGSSYLWSTITDKDDDDGFDDYGNLSIMSPPPGLEIPLKDIWENGVSSSPQPSPPPHPQQQQEQRTLMKKEENFLPNSDNFIDNEAVTGVNNQLRLPLHLCNFPDDQQFPTSATSSKMLIENPPKQQQCDESNMMLIDYQRHVAATNASSNTITTTNAITIMNPFTTTNATISDNSAIATDTTEHRSPLITLKCVKYGIDENTIPPSPLTGGFHPHHTTTIKQKQHHNDECIPLQQQLTTSNHNATDYHHTSLLRSLQSLAQTNSYQSYYNNGSTTLGPTATNHAATNNCCNGFPSPSIGCLNRPLRSQRVDVRILYAMMYRALVNSLTGGRREICVFCRNNGEHELIYTSHSLKDNRNKVTCPILRAYQCPICLSTGDKAHTIKYCPYNAAGGNLIQDTPLEKLFRYVNGSAGLTAAVSAATYSSASIPTSTGFSMPPLFPTMFIPQQQVHHYSDNNMDQCLFNNNTHINPHRIHAFSTSQSLPNINRSPQAASAATPSPPISGCFYYDGNSPSTTIQLHPSQQQHTLSQSSPNQLILYNVLLNRSASANIPSNHTSNSSLTSARSLLGASGTLMVNNTQHQQIHHQQQTANNKHHYDNTCNAECNGLFFSTPYATTK